MHDYFGRQSAEPHILLREEVLLPDYVPDNILHREAELQAIADGIKPALHKNYPRNFFLYGRSGTGKTSCMKFLLRQLSEASATVLPVYVNCWENSTMLSVYNKIIEHMRLPLPRRGLAGDELFEKIIGYMQAYKQPVILVLDEMDGLRADDVLYAISRANERPGIVFGIIGLTNKGELLASLDARVRSSLRFLSMEFRSYSTEQLFSILQKRAEVALAANTYDEQVLRKIANSAEDGNARNALELLWAAARCAESSGRSRLMLQDVADSECSVNFRFSSLGLSGGEMAVIEALKGGERGSSELYRLLEGMGRTKRQVRNYIELLERKGILESEAVEPFGLLSSKIYRLRS